MNKLNSFHKRSLKLKLEAQRRWIFQLNLIKTKIFTPKKKFQFNEWKASYPFITRFHWNFWELQSSPPFTSHIWKNWWNSKIVLKTFVVILIVIVCWKSVIYDSKLETLFYVRCEWKKKSYGINLIRFGVS